MRLICTWKIACKVIKIGDIIIKDAKTNIDNNDEKFA